MIGETISHYRILEKLGDGATAEVYKAEDLALGRPVALKLVPRELSADYGMIARFQHEARTASALNHPNICTIYEIAEHEGRHFITMELLEGQVLSRVIGGRALGIDRVVEIGIQIADALDAAHAGGVLHRDIKPANIFVTDRDHVKLLDFGLAMPMPSPHDGARAAGILSGRTSGTAPYMSPEQVRGENLDARSDLFSTGVVFYEMATGRRAFNGSDVSAIMDLVVSQPPVALREIDRSIHPELERIIGKALEKNRKLRFQTAADMRADLQRLKRDLDSVDAVMTRAQGDSDRLRIASGIPLTRNRRVALAGAVLFGTTAMVIGFASLQHTPSNTPATIASPVREIPGRQQDIVLPAAPARSAVKHRPTAAASVAPQLDTVEEPASPPAVPWAEQELRVARAKVDAKLFEQALTTLQGIAAKEGAGEAATEAYFLMASVHERQGRIEDAMATYLEFANRYPEDGRAPEALFLMAENTLRTRRATKDDEARRLLSDAAAKYPGSAWSARALMLRGQLEERNQVYQRDAALGMSVPSALVTYRAVVAQYAGTPVAETALWKLGQLYAASKQYRLAADTFAALAKRYPATRFDAWYAAADLYDKRLKESVTARAAYMRVPPSSPRFRDAQKRLR